MVRHEDVQTITTPDGLIDPEARRLIRTDGGKFQRLWPGRMLSLPLPIHFVVHYRRRARMNWCNPRHHVRACIWKVALVGHESLLSPSFSGFFLHSISLRDPLLYLSAWDLPGERERS